MSVPLKRKLLKNKERTFTLSDKDYEGLKPYIFSQDALNENLGTFCTSNNYSSILIEAVKSISFEGLIQSKPTDDIPAIGKLTNNELVLHLLSIWYQTYSTLDTCKEFYTHNDLHTGNILLYYNDAGIYNIKYFKGGKEISSILTKFVPVIIDYGRCYINCNRFEGLLRDANVLNSENILRNVCANTKCTPEAEQQKGTFLCGEKHGFMNVKGSSKIHDITLERITSEDIDDDFRFYNRDRANISNDTRLIDYSFYIMSESPRSKIRNVSGKSYINEFNTLPNQLEFWSNKTPGSETSRYFFVEEKRDIHAEHLERINSSQLLSNVTLVFKRLHGIITKDDFVKDTQNFYRIRGDRVIAEVHIDLDLANPVRFIRK